MLSNVKRRSDVRCLGRNRSGIAAIEFSFVAPMLFLMVSGSFDVAKALILKHQVADAAHLIAISATAVSISDSSKATSITDTAAQQAMSIVFAEMPWLKINIEQGTRSVTLTSVGFFPVQGCTPTSTNNCYNARVAFSVYYGGGNQSGATKFGKILRSCGTLTQIAHDAPLKIDQTQISVLRTAEVAKPDALLIADVNYKYTPVFLKVLTGSIDLWATSMSPARSGDSVSQGASQGVQYTTFSGSGGTGNCPNVPGP